MRALSVSVVLSSIILSGWLTGAEAQSPNFNAAPPLDVAPGAQMRGPGNLSPAFIAQPGVEAPGMVAGVTLGEVYTDNLQLAGGGQPKQSGWITQVQPFFRGATSSPRFSGLFDYMLTGYLYEKPWGDTQLAQNLDAQGTLTILPQHFFLDGTALYGNEIINPQRPAGSGSFFLSDNRTNVGIATLSPYWLQDLGRAGTATLRYTRGRVVYNDRGISGDNSGVLNGIPDVTSNAVQFSLVSPNYQTWGWNLGYSEQRLDPDSGRGLDFAVATVGGSFEINNNLQALANAGRENKFLPNGTTEKLQATFWNVGFQWSNTRDIFKLLVGHQFFGRSFQFSWTHHAELLTTRLSYTEQPTNYNQQLLTSSLGAQAIVPISVDTAIPSLRNNQPYLSKRLLGSVVYLMPKSTLNLTVYDESRSYFFEHSEDERVLSAGASWSYEVGARTTFTPSVNWQRYRFRDGQIDHTYYAQLQLVHRLNRKNFGSLRLRHETLGVSTAGVSTVGAPALGVPAFGIDSGLLAVHGYTANVVFVQWTHLF